MGQSLYNFSKDDDIAKKIFFKTLSTFAPFNRLYSEVLQQSTPREKTGFAALQRKGGEQLDTGTNGRGL